MTLNIKSLKAKTCESTSPAGKGLYNLTGSRTAENCSAARAGSSGRSQGQPDGRRMRGHLTYGVWLYLKNGSQKGWWSSGLISFDDIAVLVTDDINTDLDDFVIEEAGPQYVLRWWNSPTARVGRSEKLSAGGLPTGCSSS